MTLDVDGTMKRIHVYISIQFTSIQKTTQTYNPR